MYCKIGIFLSALLLINLVSLGFLEATPGKGCRPGLMMCNRRNGKRQVKLGTQLTQRRLEADDETLKTIANDIQEFGDSKYLAEMRKCRPASMYCKGKKRFFHRKKVENTSNLFGRVWRRNQRISGTMLTGI
ncbi:uncharacterized protein [Pocillopora verrucosa]|uniref:uncharacterized protein n=1 Tax=Pocillopora verrucosa TaxID=203993 RepID=UPI003342521E